MTDHSDLTFQEYQKEVHQWITQFKLGYFSPLEIGVQLAEEVGELAKEILFLYGHKIRKPHEEKGSLEEEISDVLFSLAKLCNMHDLDMSQVARQSIQKFYSRDQHLYSKTSSEE